MTRVHSFNAVNKSIGFINNNWNTLTLSLQVSISKQNNMAKLIWPTMLDFP